MATPLPVTDSNRLGDWLRQRLRKVAVPSWIASVVFHGLLAGLLLFLAQLPSCRPDIAGEGGESFREVGIRVRAASQDEPVDSPISPDDAADSQSEMSLSQLSPADPVADQPPVPLSLPTISDLPPILGAGSPVPLASVPENSLVQPNRNSAGGAPAGGAQPGGTSFLGISDSGKRFVFVIDRSHSMEADNALQAAKTELLSSLSRLDATQEFQIIFYNNDVHMLTTNGGRSNLFRASDAQRLQVSQQLGLIKPSGGTAHLPALDLALSLNAEVIFFLTDGIENPLGPSDLGRVKQRNRSGARIHCIEFGSGSECALQGSANFLKELARQNDGQYTFRQVSARSLFPYLNSK